MGRLILVLIAAWIGLAIYGGGSFDHGHVVIASSMTFFLVGMRFLHSS